MPGKQKHEPVIQIATILGYQTVAMSLMLLAAGYLTALSAPDEALVETAATVECSPTVGTQQIAADDFLDLTVAWLLH